jgi:hypothetical protein
MIFKSLTIITLFTSTFLIASCSETQNLFGLKTTEATPDTQQVENKIVENMVNPQQITPQPTTITPSTAKPVINNTTPTIKPTTSTVPTKNLLITNTNITSTSNADYIKWQATAFDSEKYVTNKAKAPTILSGLRAYNANNLGKAWISNLANNVSQNPEFISRIKQVAGNNSKNFVENASKEPAKITKLIPNSDEAFLKALEAVHSDDLRYKWLEQAFTASAKGQSIPTKTQKPLNTQAFSTGIYTSFDPNNPSIMERVIIIASAQTLGLANDSTIKPKIEALKSNPAMTKCLQYATMNMDQCKAASRGNDEVSYCVAKHGIGEVSNCFSWILP